MKGFPERFDKYFHAYSENAVFIFGLAGISFDNCLDTFLLYNFHRFGTEFDKDSIETGERGLKPHRFLEQLLRRGQPRTVSTQLRNQFGQFLEIACKVQSRLNVLY